MFDAFTRPKRLLLLSERYSSAFIELINFRLKTKRSNVRFVVMSPHHRFTVILKILFWQNIVLDAGWPLSDSNFTRKYSISEKFQASKNYCVDFISFQSCQMAILETNEQIDYVAKKFMVRKVKLVRNFTSFNELQYVECASPIRSELFPAKINGEKWILFRGKWNMESGLDNLLGAVPFLDSGIKLIIATDRQLDFFNGSDKVFIISTRLSESEIKYLYEKSDLTVGQLSSHARVARTIPHKAFEAGYFGRPYLTTGSPAIREFLGPDMSPLFVEDVSPTTIAALINKVCNEGELLRALGRGIRFRYNSIASQIITTNKFESYLEKLGKTDL